MVHFSCGPTLCRHRCWQQRSFRIHLGFYIFKRENFHRKRSKTDQSELLCGVFERSQQFFQEFVLGGKTPAKSSSVFFSARSIDRRGELPQTCSRHLVRRSSASSIHLLVGAHLHHEHSTALPKPFNILTVISVVKVPKIIHGLPSSLVWLSCNFLYQRTEDKSPYPINHHINQIL